MSGALMAVVACSGLAWWAGDAMGFSRGYADSTQCRDGDPLDRLDRQAVRHERRLAAAAQRKEEPREPVVVAPPEKPKPDTYSFHEALRGAPGKSVDRGPTLINAAPAPRVSLGPAEVRPATTEKPAAAPAPEKSAHLSAMPTSGELTLQAGAFPDKDQALRLHEALKAKGYRPIIVPSEAAGATWYRVRVGRFPDRASADVGAAALAETAKVHGIVLKD
jgi:cell division protein FtsN